MTKRNKVRLRYVVGCLSLFTAAALGVKYASPSSLALKWDARSIDVTELDQQEAPTLPVIGVKESMQKVAVAMQLPPKPINKTVKIESGDTVAGALQKAGATSSEAYYIVEALKEHFDPRTIKPGHKLTVQLNPIPEAEKAFLKMEMQIDSLKDVTIEKKSNGEYISHLAEKEVTTKTYAKFTEIETSLYGSALRDGIPPQIVAELIRTYSWNVDFQRDIRQGDMVEVLYETKETEDGEIVGYGDIQFANLGVGGKPKPIYRFKMSDGHIDYFEPDGRSIRKVLMKTPIDGARLSSGYGMRRHPILGYDKMHKGVDFAAPTGTPIYAAGDGTISFVGRKGGYGKYIQIRHNSSLITAYAHLHRFAKSMTNGKRVKQGQTIGYVGSTGRSTGPHLHYEVIKDGRQVNPRSVDLPIGEELKGKDLQRFKSLMRTIKQEYVSLSGRLKFAQSGADENSVH